MSDLGIWASYLAIGTALLLNPCAINVITIRPAHRLLFGAFVLLCGMTHLTMVVTLFAGVYRLDVLVRFATGAVSVVTALIVVNDLSLARRKDG